MLIGIAGCKGVGKTTLVNKLACDFPIRRLSFAEPLKQMLIDNFGFTHEQLYNPEQKELFNEFWNMTNRQAMERFGNGMRNEFDSNVWIKLAEIKLHKIQGMLTNSNLPLNIVYDDVRFDNEAKMIRSHGGLIINVTSSRVVDDRSCKPISELGISSDLVHLHIKNDSEGNPYENNAKFMNLCEIIKNNYQQ